VLLLHNTIQRPNKFGGVPKLENKKSLNWKPTERSLRQLQILADLVGFHLRDCYKSQFYSFVFEFN